MNSYNGSKESILSKIGRNKPALSPLPDIHFFEKNSKGSLSKFTGILKDIGGSAYFIHDLDEMIAILMEKHPPDVRIFSPIREVQAVIKTFQPDSDDAHELESVDIAILKAHFGVAENAAVWVTESQMGNRITPFICQHLAVIINEKDIVPTMHEAYMHPTLHNYNYGSFIAGPSKTADIEQSLVLGAHGPKSMNVFVVLNRDHY